MGGLTVAATAVDPFIMEYANGLPVSEVGWGQLTAAGISQILRLYNLILDLECRTPYLAQLESSNLRVIFQTSLKDSERFADEVRPMRRPSTEFYAGHQVCQQ